jgi:cytidyltransferase-like protein
MKIVVVSGGFDPIHSGHIAYFNSAKTHGEYLIVALNSDEWLARKKGKFFMPFIERKTIIENLSVVDEVIAFGDDEIGSCINALKQIKEMYPNDEITFCNGGDRNKGNIPEMGVEGINFEFEVGGSDKKNSSSWILKKHEYDGEERIWGKFFNLFTDSGETKVKVKELIVDPGKGLSFQRHFHRSEIWFVSKGACIVNYSEGEAEKYKAIDLNIENILFIKKEAWHQIINPNDKPCHIIEIQYGEKTDENDIERLRYYEETQKS